MPISSASPDVILPAITAPISSASSHVTLPAMPVPPLSSAMPVPIAAAGRIAKAQVKVTVEKEVLLFDSGYLEDNQACLVCHLDLKNEEITAIHLEAGVTCAACHGDSDAHRGDEWNVVRPDVIWGRATMEPFCKQCHPKHTNNVKYRNWVDEWNGKRRTTGRYVTENSVCMDCHGEHAIIIGEGQFK